MAIDFEPFRPINTSLYLCDNRFHTEALASLLESDATFGFIVMDGRYELGIELVFFLTAHQYLLVCFQWCSFWNSFW